MEESKIEVLTADDFVVRNRKTIEIPSGGNVIIRKINPSTFLSLGRLPTEPGAEESKQKGIVRQSPNQMMIAKLTEALAIQKKVLEETSDVAEAEKIYIEINTLEDKKAKHEREDAVFQRDLLVKIITDGLVTPKFSKEEKENSITPNDITLEDMNYISMEVLSFSGMVGGGAQELNRFSGEQKESDISG